MFNIKKWYSDIKASIKGGSSFEKSLKKVLE